MHEPVKVFFEPKVPPHDPALYDFDRTAEPVAAGALDEAAIERYRRDGYLLVRGLLAEGLVTAGRRELEAMALADDPACEQLWYEGVLRDHLAVDVSRDREVDGRRDGVGFIPGQQAEGMPALDPTLRARFVRKFAGFVDGHAPLAALAGHKGLLTLARRLLGGHSPLLFQDMALVKPAGGREKPWHQDHAYFNYALDTPIVGVWIPFGTVTPENGCMHVLEGAHRGGPRLHFKRRDWQICDGDVESANRVAVPMAAGDVLFFDGKLPHGTPVNRTDSFRWAVQFHYRPATAAEVADAERLAAFGAEGKDVTC